MTKNTNKSLARYLCVQATYQKILCKVTFKEVLKQFSSYDDKDIFFSFENSFKKKNFEVDLNYFKKIIRNSDDNEKKIIELIEKNLSEKWKIERLPILLNAILISAVSEIILSPKLSLGIIASEYILLTETFFLENESSFVNAVISNIYISNQKNHE